MKFKCITYTPFGILLPVIGQSMYTKEEASIAQKVLSQTLPGEKYHPVIKLASAENKTGKANVYRDEYGVCVLINDESLNQLLQQVNKLAYPDDLMRPEITPHITILQGVFKKDKREALAEVVKQAALDTKTQTITFEKYFVKGGGDNIFLDVAKGKDFFDALNTRLTKAVIPDAPMKQVIDDIQAGTANLQEMHTGGAWRDFNIPGSNRPHITAVYGKQDDEALKEANNLLANHQFSFNPIALSIYQVDYRGNLYGEPLYQVTLAQ